MNRRSIAKMFAEIRLHRRQDVWQKGRGSVVVQINSSHTNFTILHFNRLAQAC